MTFLVGFGHKARQGKDTAAKHLWNKYKDRYFINLYSFAEALKSEMYDVLLNRNHPYWQLAEGEYDALPHPDGLAVTVDQKAAWSDAHRNELLTHFQSYGTEFTRANDPFYWIKRVNDQIEADKPQFAFITDVRFQNEFLYIKSSGGFTIKCVREGFVAEDRDPNHRSEIDLDKAVFDFVISVPDGDVAQLCKDAEEVFEHILRQITPEIPEAGDGLSKAA